MELGIATHTQGAAILAQPPGRTGPLLRSGCSICSETNVHNRSRAVIRELPRGAHILWGKSEWKLFGEKKLVIGVRGWKWGCRRFRSTCSPASAHRPACRPAARGRRWGLPPFNWRMPTCGTGSRVSQMRWLSPRMAGECSPWLR